MVQDIFVYLEPGYLLMRVFPPEVFEEERLLDFFVVKGLHHSLALDDGLMQPITLELNNEIENDMFDIQVYFKTPVILRMVQHAITDEVFRKGIRKFLIRHQFKSATPDDLWSAMQSALDERSYIPPYNDYRIKEVMDTWTKQKRYPVLNVTRNYETGEVTITQKCCLEKNDTNNNDTNNEWWIPITFATQSNPDFSRTVPDHWLRPDQTILFKIHASDWIIVNVQQTAYCRVYYDTTNWYKIIHYLNSVDFQKIHVLNRAQLIDDAYAFLLQKQLNTSVFFDLTNYLSQEKDYVAWYPMFRILTLLSSYYPLPQSENFKSHMVAIFDKLLQYIGHEENPNDTDTMKMLRLDAVKWLHIFDHSESEIIAEYKLKRDLRHLNIYNVLRGWQNSTYCFGLAIANWTTWDKMFKLYKRTHDKKFWKNLSCFENPDIIIGYLNILAANRYNKLSTKLFDDQADASIFKTIIEKHANNGLILDFIFKHLQMIKPRLITTAQLIKYFILNVHCNELLDKLRKYSETYLYLHDYNLTLELMSKRKKYLKKMGDNFAKKFGKLENN